MAVDKLVDSAKLDADLSAVANAIRTTGGTSADLAFPADFLTAIAAIPSGGGGAKFKSGTVTYPQDFTTSGTVRIAYDEEVGFDPDVFLFCVSDRASVGGVPNAVLFAVYANAPAGNPYRACAKYEDEVGSIGANARASDWTQRADAQLYRSNGRIYYHTHPSYVLLANKEYAWFALGLPST